MQWGNAKPLSVNLPLLMEQYEDHCYPQLGVLIPHSAAVEYLEQDRQVFER